MSRKQQDTAPDVGLFTDDQEIEHRERALDDALKGSFPASDPPAAVAPHSPRS